MKQHSYDIVASFSRHSIQRRIRSKAESCVGTLHNCRLEDDEIIARSEEMASCEMERSRRLEQSKRHLAPGDYLSTLEHSAKKANGTDLEISEDFMESRHCIARKRSNNTADVGRDL
jgi:hypothetical protein